MGKTEITITDQTATPAMPTLKLRQAGRQIGYFNKTLDEFKEFKDVFKGWINYFFDK